MVGKPLAPRASDTVIEESRCCFFPGQSSATVDLRIDGMAAGQQIQLFAVQRTSGQCKLTHQLRVEKEMGVFFFSREHASHQF